MLTKSEKYYYDWQAVREPADGGGLRNRRSVWHVNTRPFAGAHFATFPPDLIRPCIQASTEPGDYVLDPFFGSGTVGLVCQDENRQYVGIELNPEYVALAADRLQGQVFEIIREIVAHAAAEVRESAIEVNSATGRPFLIEFAPDPDIIIREEMEHQHYRNVVAIEVKSGTDVSNIHNRIGEAEKSHQKARQRGFTECWTVVNVGRLDMVKARSESPSTDRFYSLAALSLRAGDEYDDFRRRVLSLTAIPSAPLTKT